MSVWMLLFAWLLQYSCFALFKMSVRLLRVGAAWAILSALKAQTCHWCTISYVSAVMWFPSGFTSHFHKRLNCTELKRKPCGLNYDVTIRADMVLYLVKQFPHCLTNIRSASFSHKCPKKKTLTLTEHSFAGQRLMTLWGTSVRPNEVKTHTYFLFYSFHLLTLIRLNKTTASLFSSESSCEGAHMSAPCRWITSCRVHGPAVFGPRGKPGPTCRSSSLVLLLTFFTGVLRFAPGHRQHTRKLPDVLHLTWSKWPAE